MAVARSRRSGSESRAREQFILSGPPGYWEAVKAEAKRRGVPASQLVRDAIAAYLAATPTE